MNYKKFLKKVAKKENVSQEMIEREMLLAIRSAGFDCTAKEFIEAIVKIIKERTIYSNLV